MRPNRSGLSPFLLAALFVLVTVLTVGAFLYKEWRPGVASEHGTGIDRMITYIIFVAGSIFVVGHGVLTVLVLKYRRTDGPAYKPMSHRSEIAFTVAPVVFMVAVSEIGTLFLGGPVWSQVFTKQKDDVEIEIVAKQFEWLGRYPGRDGKFGRREAKFMDEQDNPLGLDPKDPAAKDDIVMRGTITVPEGKGVWLDITSWDVLHSWNVPLLRSKQDAVPGMHTHTRFFATKEGRYEIACAEICGPGHYRMRGYVQVKKTEDFGKWLASQVGWFE